MAWMGSIGRQITEVGHGVAQQTKNLAEITRCNSAISDAKKKIDSIYIEIGRGYFERHRYDPEGLERERISQILQLMAEIEKNEEQIKQLKGVTKCQRCGGEVPLGARFCNVCGAPVERVQKLQRVCAVCGAPLGEGHLFCMNCGAKNEKNETAPSQPAFSMQPRTCPACGTTLDQGAAFCPECGTKVNVEMWQNAPQELDAEPKAEVTLTAEVDAERTAAKDPVRTCPACQAELESGDLFCPECGTRMP